MVYVDLNPVRAGIAASVESSDHTSVQKRSNELRSAPERANQLLLPIAGLAVLSNKEIAGRLAMSNRQYIELVDYTGRQINKGKRGKISETEPPALRRLGLDGDLWSRQVLGIRDGYWRVVASAEAMMEKAAQIGQKWLKGIGFARSLAENR